ncbi:LPS export ABC transporter periplasmic protein LptC [Marinobacter sp. 1Y8]
MIFGPLSRVRLRNIAIGIVALALVALLWKSGDHTTSDPTSDLRGPKEPDSFIVNGEYRSFDQTGHTSAVITSPRIEQFETQETAHMQEPRARMIDAKSGQPWTLRADEGEYQLNKDIVDLSGNVIITRTIGGSTESQLKTESLTLDNEQRIVHTDAPVVMTDPSGVTRATGMKAWIDERIVELNSQVEGQYESSSPR